MFWVSCKLYILYSDWILRNNIKNIVYKFHTKNIHNINVSKKTENKKIIILTSLKNYLPYP